MNMSEQTYAHVACDFCNFHRSKCIKTAVSCAQCESRGRDCTYDRHIKRKQQKQREQRKSKPMAMAQQEQSLEDDIPPSSECCTNKHNSPDATTTASKSPPSNISGLSDVGTSTHKPNPDNLLGTNPTGISPMESMIDAMYKLERQARFDLFTDDTFVSLLRDNLDIIIAPLLERLLDGKMADFEQRTRRTAEIEDKLNRVDRTQHEIAMMLHQYRLELNSLGSQLSQQFEWIRQYIELSRTRASEGYLEGFNPSAINTQPGQSLGNMLVGFEGI